MSEVERQHLDFEALEQRLALGFSWRSLNYKDLVLRPLGQEYFLGATKTAPIIAQVLKGFLIQEKITHIWSENLVTRFVSWLAADAAALGKNETISTPEAEGKRQRDTIARGIEQNRRNTHE